MGNESSTLVDEKTPPSVLEARNIEAVAKYIKEKPVRRIVVMVRSQHLCLQNGVAANYLHLGWSWNQYGGWHS